MLTITIKGEEIYNEETAEFSTINDVVVDLEHSLVSLSKWESKHKKPFLTTEERTAEEIFDYIECMVLTPGITSEMLLRCDKDVLTEIQEYIDSSQSATTFYERPGRNGRGETITSELVYYWMFSCQIPIECETWHLNRLFTLIRVFNVKNSKQKKMPRHEIARRNQALNEQRRAALGTTG
jgi:hypothetical protein